MRRKADGRRGAVWAPDLTGHGLVRIIWDDGGGGTDNEPRVSGLLRASSIEAICCRDLRELLGIGRIKIKGDEFAKACTGAFPYNP